MRVHHVVLFAVVAGTALPIVLHHEAHGVLNPHQIALAFFLWLNTIIALWEICLFLRIGLIACAVVHIWSAVVLTRRALAARPVRYKSKKPAKGESRHAVATMRWGAVVVFLFIIWHLLDLTFRTVNPVKDVPDAYGAVVATFSPERWPVTVFYLLALFALFFHLRHGIWSAVQTIAGPDSKWRKRTQAIGLAVAVVIILGFAIVPLSVTFGLVK